MEEVQSVSIVLDEFISNIDLVTSKLRDEEFAREEKQGFSIDEFWLRIGAAVELLSKDATRLCLAFSNPPFPSAKDCGPLLRSLEQSTLTLVSTFYSLPKTQGKVLHKQVNSVVLSIISSVGLLASVVKHNNPQKSKEHLHSTGTVWQYCDSVKAMPKNNKEAVLGFMKETDELVGDALKEITEVLESPDDNSSMGFSDDIAEPTWTEEDKKLVAPSVGIVKATKAAVKKSRTCLSSRGSCETHARITELDDVANRLSGLNSAVDDLVSGLYPPMTNLDSIKSNAEHLVSILKNLLSQLRESDLTMDADSSWITFLDHAVDHNFSKIEEIISS